MCIRDRLKVKQCRFDDETWDAPATDFSPLGSAPSGLGWGSNVDENGMGVTAPLSIKPSPTRLMDRIKDFNKANERRIERVAQLPTELLQDIPEEVGGWGSLTDEEVEMIERQRQSDVGLKSIEEIENQFPADEFDSSVWKDPVPETTIPQDEPTIEAVVVEGEPSEEPVDAVELEAVVVEGEPSEEPVDAVELGGIDLEEPSEISAADGSSDEEELVDHLLETSTPLIDSVLEESTDEAAGEEDFGNYFIPMKDLPKDEPEQTSEQKERDALKLAPLPKFKKTNDFFGEFDQPVLAIKELPGLKGKKKKKTCLLYTSDAADE